MRLRSLMICLLLVLPALSLSLPPKYLRPQPWWRAPHSLKCHCLLAFIRIAFLPLSFFLCLANSYSRPSLNVPSFIHSTSIYEVSHALFLVCSWLHHSPLLLHTSALGGYWTVWVGSWVSRSGGIIFGSQFVRPWISLLSPQSPNFINCKRGTIQYLIGPTIVWSSQDSSLLSGRT